MQVFRYISSICVIGIGLSLFADTYHTILHLGHDQYITPTDSIARLDFTDKDSISININDSLTIGFADVDSITYSSNINDTLTIQYMNDDIVINNPRADAISIIKGPDYADVQIAISTRIQNPVLSISGESNDGRLRIDSDVDYTLVLNGINLSSSHAPAINSTTKQKVNVVIADGTENALSDGSIYKLSDTSEPTNGCLTSLGALTFNGNGTLRVTGNNKHAIHSKKSIKFNSGTYIVGKAASDAIHSGKDITVNDGNFNLSGMDGEGFDMDGEFKMTGGTINMQITGEAAKGIKCAETMKISDGSITATASGALKNKKGDLSYCTVLKCDSSATISGGEFHIINNSAGGKCISVDKNLTISGGEMYFETNGDGAEYTNTDGETDYYTSKCISVDDSLFIHRGNMQCLSTGIGGKGIVGGRYTEIGMPSDTTINQGPTICVETTNSSIVNDVEEDERNGCPKAIKVEEYLNIYSGDIHCTTAGMGGEGVECGKEFYFYNGNIECNCFDDGINVGEKLEILGGQVYCNSIDNDGIDSNGSIYLKGGLIVAINQSWPNESFDSERGQLHLMGATVFGIGSSEVKIGESIVPVYNTISHYTPSDMSGFGLEIEQEKYIYFFENGDIAYAIMNHNKGTYGSYITFASPNIDSNKFYSLFQGDKPSSYKEAKFGDNLLTGGYPVNPIIVILDIFEQQQ